jgi:hypothetical protein
MCRNDYKTVCPHCGGDIIGDGYTTVCHCENADVPLDAEPDSHTIFCCDTSKNKS